MTEKRYIYASVGVSFEILDSWFGYTGDDEPTEREIEEYDYLVIGLAPDQDAADGICRRLNDQQDEINHLSNFNLHVILDKKNKKIEQLEQFKKKVFQLIDNKQKISKENMEEWAFKDVPASATREYYYSGMLDACMQLRDEILNGDVEYD